MKKLWSILLATCLLLTLFPAAGLASDAAGAKTLALREDWRLTSDLDLNVGEGEVLIFNGTGSYYVYEMGGILKNTGAGSVYLKNVVIYAQGDSPSANSLAALSQASRSIKAVAAPVKNATALALPAAAGFSVSIKSSSKPDVIAVSGTIVPPSSDTPVTLVLTLADSRGNQADTASISVTVPAKVQSGGFISGPSGGGTTTPSAPTLPTAEGGVKVAYSQTGDAVLLSLPSDKVKEIISKSTGSAILDLSGISGASKAELPKEALSSIASAGLGTEIRLPEGVVSISPEAVQSIISQLSGANISFNFNTAVSSQLNAAQQKALSSGEKVLSVSISSGTQSVHSFEGTIKVTATYSGVPPVGVWHLTDAGERTEKVPSTYDETTGRVSFDAPHFSLYVLGQDTETPAWENPFADVHSSDWFYHDVEFAVTAGLFNGTDGTAFSPDQSMTRGMLVAVLGRLHDAEIGGFTASSFADVDTALYYAPYVEWARTNGIVEGVLEDRFAPDAPVSRQDLAAILLRYAGFTGQPLAAPQDNAGFADAASISDYAVTAIQTLYGNGIIEGGGDNRIDPKGDATRAQVAAILHRFVEQNQQD
ncbi:MAG: cell wall/surface repeat protein [Paenibacillaceae bacterium]|jgi:hypothetical protein|nr:cell wall/surface repeat protein [Paenibacillaceae bacterium]